MLLAGDSETEFRAVTIGEPVSIELPAQEAATVTHDSGARIEIPAGTNIESTTVSVAEVEPPVSFVPVGRVFDFSIVDRDGKEVELQQPVTVTLPYELPEGKEHSDVVVLHWNEEESEWEAVGGGAVDEANQTVTVTVTDLSSFGSSWLQSLVESFEQSASFLIDTTFGEDYEAGFKHLVAFKAYASTHKVKPESTEGRPWGQPLKKPAGAPLNLG